MSLIGETLRAEEEDDAGPTVTLLFRAGDSSDTVEEADAETEGAMRDEAGVELRFSAGRSRGVTDDSDCFEGESTASSPVGEGSSLTTDLSPGCCC